MKEKQILLTAEEISLVTTALEMAVRSYDLYKEEMEEAGHPLDPDYMATGERYKHLKTRFLFENF